MLVEQITSRQNPLIKRAVRVRDGAEPGSLFVEGIRQAEEALDAGLRIEALIYTASLEASERGAALLAKTRTGRFRGALVPDALLGSVADTSSPQGIVLIARQPDYALADVIAGERPLVVALDALQDPGNVGTIVRAAEASGARGVVTTPGTAEPFSPKALRAAMGSAFRIPIVRRTQVSALATEARSRGMLIAAATGSGAVRYDEVDWRGPTVLFVGNEGAGLTQTTVELADVAVAIPLAPPVESLNAALAAAVVLFEAARQRRSAGLLE